MTGNFNGERQSGSGSLEESVAALVAQLPHLATSVQVINLEKSIETWKREMNDSIHQISASKVKDAMEAHREAMRNQREKCGLEFDRMVDDKFHEHEEKFHARTSRNPDPDIKKMKAFLTVLGPFLLKYVLPFVLGGGAILGGQQIINKPAPSANVAPAQNGDNTE